MAKYLGYLRLQWKFLLESNETDPPGASGRYVIRRIIFIERVDFSSFQKIISASSLIDQKRLIASFYYHIFKLS
ncbi:BEM_collapsed_G0021870.mRNA.1.CDS.1 [Saccharomyces cerevisiae]|nr:BEM_collapsed_G0021870.mRNA.1.CDS.1 [Saccharomyces cerevisiae]